jgi:uncharacterized protein (DUF2132 family)
MNRIIARPQRVLALNEISERSIVSVPEKQDPQKQPHNPLHGVTLEMIVTKLVERYGWEELGRMIDIRCFNVDPSVKSSLKFLRKTPWARKKVEDLYLRGKP